MMHKSIGIIGGMGPEASVYLYKTLIEQSVQVFGARNNDDFPAILLDSVPVPDIISSQHNRKKALSMLKKSVGKYESDSTLCLSLACNTVHCLLDDLQKATKIPFISMIDEVVNEVSAMGFKKIGIIASPETIRLKLYHEALERKGIIVIEPTRFKSAEIEKVIRDVISGRIEEKDTEKLRLIADSLILKGAQGIILGCTEIPLVFPKKYPLPVFNSVEILCTALLKKYYLVGKGGGR